jgi:large conductance mechanosensitive channel
MKIVQEFKAFIMRGNVIDLAVGIIIGTAFGKVVSDLVAKVIMPPIGLLLGKVDFSGLKIVLQHEVRNAVDKTKVDVAEVAIGIGSFINTVIDFLIVAAAIFLVIKLMSSLKRKEEAKPTLPPEPTKQEVLLGEIRDILKSK